MNQAEIQRLLDDLSLHDLLARYPRRPGAPAIRALLAARAAGATVTRSELEVKFLEFVDELGLPSPQTNQWIEGFEGWRPLRVTWRQLEKSRPDLERDLRRMLGLSAVTLAA
jgi:hypothetical protein